MNKIFMAFFLFFLALFLILFYYFFIGRAPEQKEIVWGVNFSQKHAENMGLDWKKAYLALMEDLGAKNIKLIIHWDWIEGKRDDYYFRDTDWQVKETESRNAKLIAVVGMKTGRWPECHLPEWAKGISKEEQQKEILEYIKEIVLRYKDSKAVVAWQVENEPLFKFGQCPWSDKKFLKEETKLVKSLDPERPVIVSDSGEQSLWFGPAEIGDIVGVTMYRKVWGSLSDIYGFYVKSFLPPVHYWRKALIVKKLFGKETICVELQAEPWGQKLLYDIPLEEQEKTMSLEKFRENIEFAEKTGFKKFYLWGAEWWYWLKEKQNKPEIWNEAKKLFNKSYSI